MPPWCRVHKNGGTLLLLSVSPGSSRTEFKGEHHGRLKVGLHAPPERGKANQELVRLLATRLRVPQHTVVLEKGMAGRLKSIHLQSLEPAEVTTRLGFT